MEWPVEMGAPMKHDSARWRRGQVEDKTAHYDVLNVFDGMTREGENLKANVELERLNRIADDLEPGGNGIVGNITGSELNRADEELTRFSQVGGIAGEHPPDFAVVREVSWVGADTVDVGHGDQFTKLIHVGRLERRL